MYEPLTEKQIQQIHRREESPRGWPLRAIFIYWVMLTMAYDLAKKLSVSSTINISWMSKSDMSSYKGKMSDLRKAQHGKVARGDGLLVQPNVPSINDWTRRKANGQEWASQGMSEHNLLYNIKPSATFGNNLVINIQMKSSHLKTQKLP